MRQFFILSIIMVLAAGLTYGRSVPFTFQAKTKIIGDSVRYENRAYTYYFKVEVISDLSGRKSELSRNGKPFIEAIPEERYAVRIYNPLPVRAGVNLTVDGLSSITGKPVGPSNGKKWIIAPYSFVTIRGWQVSGDEVRRFFFTSKDASYAAWRSNAWGKDLSVNCGVIGAAFFWSKGDIEHWLEANPVYEKDNYNEYSKSDKAPQSATRTGQKAGTGMGEAESHPVKSVVFNYDTGMYRASQAAVIYYDFADVKPQPDPFPDEFAPKMP